MNIVDLFSRRDKNAEKYCLDAKPEDFYYEMGNNLFLNVDEISEALSNARTEFAFGSQKAAMLLVCKIADSYREFQKKIEEKRNG